MKLSFLLQSDQLSENENEHLMLNMIDIDWDYPFLPRIGEIVQAEMFSEIEIEYSMPGFFELLDWMVTGIRYSTFGGEIYAIIECSGHK